MLAHLIVLTMILTLILLVAVVRLGREQRRHRREIQVRLATMAVLLEQARRVDLAGDHGLTPAEERTLAALRERLMGPGGGRLAPRRDIPQSKADMAAP